MTNPDLAAIWTATHERTVGLLEGLTPEQAESPVPATDAWTARQLASHMVGVGVDAVAGKAEAEASPQWTEGHVQSRASASVADLLAEWRAAAPQVRELLQTGPAEDVGPVCVDVYWHEQDLRTALPGAAPVTGDPALQMGLDAFAGGFAGRVTEQGLPAVRLVAGDWSLVAGEGEPQVEVSADRFELARALSGRRSPAQVSAFAWSGDPAPYLPIFSMFGDLRTTDLVEQG